LQSEGDFVGVLHEARHTFDLQATNANIMLRTYAEPIEDALRRGVVVRFLLFDHGKNCDYFGAAVKKDCALLASRFRESLFDAKVIRKRVPDGRFEVRLYPDVPLKSFWIRDAATDQSVLHVEFIERDEAKRASFTMGRLSDAAYEAFLQKQFNDAWESLQPVDLTH
jgi:hypothetical protein